MNKAKAGILGLIMVLSMIFIEGAVSSGNNAFVARAQTVAVTRKRKGGIARRTYRGGKYVVRRTWDGTKYVSKRVWVGTKWTGRTTWKGGRKVVSHTKKVIY